ncbi:AAA family ATPase [Pseudomonas sp. TMP9]|uniref:AAA family ATPase n=1 Tax=Pseudomonas sp. TMP9 TaxID=3133144 RepID=UPI0030CF9312
MACAQSGAALAGSESFWGNSQPGQLFNLLASQQNANPMVMLDELDKAGGDERFDPLAALHTLLEPAAARNFVDLSVRDLAINASHVNWLATANDLERLSKPILSRFSVLHIPAPSADQVSIIVRNLYNQTRDESSWGQHFADTLCDEVVERMSTLAPRKIRITLQRAFGAAARSGRSCIQPEDLKIQTPEKPKVFGFIASP